MNSNCENGSGGMNSPSINCAKKRTPRTVVTKRANDDSSILHKYSTSDYISTSIEPSNRFVCNQSRLTDLRAASCTPVGSTVNLLAPTDHRASADIFTDELRDVSCRTDLAVALLYTNVQILVDDVIWPSGPARFVKLGFINQVFTRVIANTE